MQILFKNNALKAVESHLRGLDYKPIVVGANIFNMEEFKLGELTLLEVYPGCKKEKRKKKAKYRCFCGNEFITDTSAINGRSIMGTKSFSL